MNLVIFSSSLTLFLIFTAVTAQDPFVDIACTLIKCGEGTCRATNDTLHPIACDCFPGYKSILVGPIPMCLLPNCTTDFSCGSGSPLPPPSLPGPINFTDPCFLSWCAEGTCVAKGTDHTCQCNPGADNLLNNPALPCFEECVFGGDCSGPSFGVPPPSPSGSNKNGKGDVLNSSGTRYFLSMLVLLAISVSMF